MYTCRLFSAVLLRSFCVSVFVFLFSFHILCVTLHCMGSDGERSVGTQTDKKDKCVYVVDGGGGDGEWEIRLTREW